MAINIKVNGTMHSVPAAPDTPLLYVLRNDLGLNGAKFGCGLAQCGACTVLVDGRRMLGCLTLAVAVRGAGEGDRGARRAGRRVAAGFHRSECESRGSLTLESKLRERDGLSAAGNEIRTLSPSHGLRPFRASVAQRRRYAARLDHACFMATR